MRSTRLHLLLASLLLPTSAAPAALTFNITNQGTATPRMLAGVNQAAALWSARLHDPITINIRISAASIGSTIAHTETFYDPYSYSSVRQALLADRQSIDDLSATNSLQPAPAFSMLLNYTANNPAGVVSPTPYFDTGLGGPGQAGPENNSTIRMSSANAKALALIPGNVTGLDGTIVFNSLVAYDYDRSNGISPTLFDFTGIAVHEIGHLLGFTSGVDILAGNSLAPGLNDNQLRFATTLDLFRFSTRSIGPGGGLGVIDWAADDTPKYFSVDGGQTPVAAFSTGPINEASHWDIDLGIGIMDPSVNPGELLTISSADARAFDTIGYDIFTLPIPEPASAALLLLPPILASRRPRPTHRRPTPPRPTPPCPTLRAQPKLPP